MNYITGITVMSKFTPNGYKLLVDVSGSAAGVITGVFSGNIAPVVRSV